DLGASASQPIARIRTAAAALGLPWWTIAPFGVTDGEADEPGPGGQPGLRISEDGPEDHAPLRINASPAPAYRGDSDRMLADVRNWLGGGGEGIGARRQDLGDAPEPGVPYVTTARVGNGFVWPAVRLVLLTESDLAGH